MKTKIIASTSVIGSALVAVALTIGAPTIEANAGDVPTLNEEGAVELTAPQALAFANIAKSIWAETAIANVKQFVLWRTRTTVENEGQEPTTTVSVHAYSIERVTTNEETFAALAMAREVWKGDGCEVAHDPGAETVAYCIKRGADELSGPQIAAVVTATKAVIGSIVGVDRIHLRAGPPRTLEVVGVVDKTPAEFAACYAAGTCKPAR